MTLVLKRASASRPSGEWNDDDFDVLADGVARAALRELRAAVLARRRSHANTRLCRDPRGRDGSIREELAAGVKESPGRTGAFQRRSKGGVMLTLSRLSDFIPRRRSRKAPRGLPRRQTLGILVMLTFTAVNGCVCVSGRKRCFCRHGTRSQRRSS